MMCRLVHRASYHTIKEIENEMTIETTKSVKATPFGMSLNANAAAGVAWGNFDRFMETETGKDMLHDTVGIVYQVLEKSQPNILEDNREKQHQCGLDGTPDLVLNTILFKKYGTSHKSISLQHPNQ